MKLRKVKKPPLVVRSETSIPSCPIALQQERDGSNNDSHDTDVAAVDSRTADDDRGRRVGVGARAVARSGAHGSGVGDGRGRSRGGDHAGRVGRVRGRRGGDVGGRRGHGGSDVGGRGLVDGSGRVDGRRLVVRRRRRLVLGSLDRDGRLLVRRGRRRLDGDGADGRGGGNLVSRLDVVDRRHHVGGRDGAGGPAVRGVIVAVARVNVVPSVSTVVVAAVDGDIVSRVPHVDAVGRALMGRAVGLIHVDALGDLDLEAKLGLDAQNIDIEVRAEIEKRRARREGGRGDDGRGGNGDERRLHCCDCVFLSGTGRMEVFKYVIGSFEKSGRVDKKSEAQQEK